MLLITLSYNNLLDISIGSHLQDTLLQLPIWKCMQWQKLGLKHLHSYKPHSKCSNSVLIYYQSNSWKTACATLFYSLWGLHRLFPHLLLCLDFSRSFSLSFLCSLCRCSRSLCLSLCLWESASREAKKIKKSSWEKTPRLPHEPLHFSPPHTSIFCDSKFVTKILISEVLNGFMVPAAQVNSSWQQLRLYGLWFNDL